MKLNSNSAKIYSFCIIIYQGEKVWYWGWTVHKNRPIPSANFKFWTGLLGFSSFCPYAVRCIWFGSVS